MHPNYFNDLDKVDLENKIRKFRYLCNNYTLFIIMNYVF